MFNQSQNLNKKKRKTSRNDNLNRNSKVTLKQYKITNLLLLLFVN